MVDAPEKIWTDDDYHYEKRNPQRKHAVEYTRSDIVAELAAENERQSKLLAGRDSFIVDQGLWGDFVASLPPAKQSLASTGAVKVKALVWEGPFNSGENGSSYDHIYADSALGRYTFDWKSWKKFDPPTSTDCPGDFFYCASDLDDAKAAAQDDYNRRILSALEDHPRDTNTVDAHETANVSDKPEGQQEPVVDTEPWGYWVKHKYAEGGLVRTPCFIPEESHYTEVLPLYTSPPTSELEAERARLEARLAEAKRERDETKAEIGKIMMQNFERLADVSAQRDEALKALEPFAAVAEHDIGDDETDDDIFWPISNARYSMSGRLRVGHLRAARRVREGGEANG